MGIFDSAEKFYNKNFVSHSTKFKNRHGVFIAKNLNKIFNDEFDPYEFPAGLTKSNKLISSESELYFLNDLPINTISLCETIAQICFASFMTDKETIDEAFKTLSISIVKGSKNKFSEKFVLEKLNECLALYKNLFNSDLYLPNFLHIYFDGWDVETDGHLDNIFKTFYTIQGNVFFISSQTYNKRSDIISIFFREHHYRLFTAEEDIYEVEKIRQLSNNAISLNHIKLLQSKMYSNDWSYMKLLEIVRNVAVFSGYNDVEASCHHKILLSQLDEEIYNWTEISYLVPVFYDFPNNKGYINSAQLSKFLGIIYRTEMVKN